jgi:hypothetical protein
MVKVIAVAGLVLVGLSGCAVKDTGPPIENIVTPPTQNIRQARESVTSAQGSLDTSYDIAVAANKQGIAANSQTAKDLIDSIQSARKDLVTSLFELAQAEARAEEVEKERAQFQKQWQATYTALERQKKTTIEAEVARKHAVRHRNILAAILSFILLGALGFVIFKVYTGGLIRLKL